MKSVVRFHLYNPQQAQQSVVRWKYVEEIKFGRSALFYLSEEKKKVRTRVQHVLKALEINYHLCFILYMKMLNLTLYHSTPLSLIHTPYRLPPPPRRRLIPTRTLQSQNLLVPNFFAISIRILMLPRIMIFGEDANEDIGDLVLSLNICIS